MRGDFACVADISGVFTVFFVGCTHYAEFLWLFLPFQLKQLPEGVPSCLLSSNRSLLGACGVGGLGLSFPIIGFYVVFLMCLF
jgi:hypothetical protein